MNRGNSHTDQRAAQGQPCNFAHGCRPIRCNQNAHRGPKGSPEGRQEDNKDQ